MTRDRLQAAINRAAAEYDDRGPRCIFCRAPLAVRRKRGFGTPKKLRVCPDCREYHLRMLASAQDAD